MISTDSVSGQSLKSGSSCSVAGGICAISPDESADLRLLQREVGGGERRRHRDAELEEVGDQHAPQPGDRRERDVDAPRRRASVCHIGQPSSTLAIFAAARFTVAMITMLKNRPR